jgi:hypothetical protein
LHRHDYTKNILMECLNESTVNKIDIFEDVKFISDLLTIDMRTVIEYPDKTRDLLIDNYLNKPDEKELIDKIKNLIDNYTIENKNELIKLIRLNHSVNNNSQLIT